MRTLVVAAFGGGVASGMLVVAVPAVAAGHQFADLTGLLFAGFAAGELLGGVAYGARDWPLRTSRRLLAGQAGTAASLGALVLVSGEPWAMLAVLVVAGSVVAPTSIANSALLDDVAPTGSLARAYTVMVAAGLLGAAAGSSGGGALGGAAGQRPVLLVAAGAMVAVLAWTALRARTLDRPTGIAVLRVAGAYRQG